MHEATVAESILKIACRKFRETPNTARVLRVHVIAGEFRNIDSESLKFAFDNLKSLYDGTSLCTLKLDIIRAQALCCQEQHKYHPEYEHAYRCEICGSGIGKLLCGEELDVVNISLEALANEEHKGNARISKSIINEEHKGHARIS